MTQQGTGAWRPTALHLRALVGGLGLALLAVVGHRPDLAVLATPFLLIACWGQACRPCSRPVTQVQGQGADLVEGQAVTVRVRTSDAHGAETVGHDLGATHGLRLRPQARAALVRGGADEGSFLVQPVRWGPARVGDGEHHLRSVWGAFDSRWLARRPIELTVAPAPGAFASDAPVPRPSRMLGLHGARHAGEGSEFNDIRLFQPGDRPRLVHWPTSVRTGRLHVRTTYAQADTQVLLVVDAFADVPAASEQDEGSLSRTVHAASSVAAWCLRTGDRIGLRVMGAVTTPVPVGHGRRHYLRVLGTLGRLRPGSDRTPASRRPRLSTPPGSLVVVLSPLTETQVVELAAQQAASGLDVLVVDTAPDLSDPGGLSSVEHAARQVLELERERTVAALAHRGVAVVSWRGPGTLDTALTAMSRPRSGA
ncbi:DUF58 domain-containing protein [Actinomyces faecalis]|uniref:DUF58 domain-containing protein n=1 Tax=Actinomyces faecalis TaxID=2722820 RepID=UPI001553948E|nr:DUF58 domain-containing protein [Actinomyces faecalis]